MIYKEAIKYYRRADTLYSIHSPFVFQLLQETLENDKQFYDFVALEQLHYLSAQNQDQIQITDLGAGSKVDKGNLRTIGQLAKNSVSPLWQCRFLYKLINHLQLKNRLELGTSLGVAALYQYLPIRQGKMYTLEGCPNIAKVAAKNFERFKTQNLEIEVGDFSESLPMVLQKMGQLDYVFLDGNHQLKPTLNYFEACLPYAHNDTVFVLDDIYWSEEMKQAWEAVKNHPSVTLTLDFFYFGIVFVRQEQKEKQHFSVIRTCYKPWRVSLL